MRAFVCTWRGEWPKTSMCPFVGLSKPSSSLTVVDLPEPFGPSRPNTSPRRTSKSTLSTARALGRFQKSLNTLVRPRTETTTSSDLRFATGDCGFNSATGMVVSILFLDQQAQDDSQTGFVQSFFGNFNHGLINRAVIFRKPDAVQSQKRNGGSGGSPFVTIYKSL